MGEVKDFADRVTHLYELHAAPPETWSTLAEALLSADWSVKDTHYNVEQVLRFFEKDDTGKHQYIVPDDWRFFLPMDNVIEKYLATKEFAPSTVEQIWKQAEETVTMIRGFNIGEETIDATINEYRDWLVGQAWDVRVLKQHHDELKNQLEAQERAAAYSLGDWREHIGKLNDGTVKLLLTDPPYGMNYKSDYKLDRREERLHQHIENDAPEDAIHEISECIRKCMPKLRDDAHVLCFCHWSNEHETRKALEDSGLKVRGSLIWEKNNAGMGDPKTTFAPKHERIIHAVKGSPILYERKPDVLHAARCDSKNHPTEKPVSLLVELIETTTAKGDMVLDPFAGVASTLVAARSIDRDYFGCEIEEKYYEIGKLRLR
jgi:site-specific DNA-methyltransferase (adenine-specific)